jgi:HD-like signal output (HDOD) protein
VIHAILFADDDETLPPSLRRPLKGLEATWASDFAASAAEAIGFLRGRAYDVVVSGMRLRGPDGAQLLETVRELQPAAIRVILSGNAEEQGLFRSVAIAHQYLSRPVEAGALVTLMDRARAARAMLADPALQAAVGRLGNLPSPPDLYLRLTAAMSRKNPAPAEISRILDEDPAMVAKLLSLTNSAFFAVGNKVRRVEQAVHVLGMETLRTLALSHALFRQAEGNASMLPLLKEYKWHAQAMSQESLAFAQADRAGAALRQETYAAGILSGIGRFAMCEAAPNIMSGLAALGHAAALDAERAHFGATHETVGAYLLGLWGFPETIMEAVLLQSAPIDDTQKSNGRPAIYVQKATRKLYGAAAPAPKPAQGGLFRREAAAAPR